MPNLDLRTEDIDAVIFDCDGTLVDSEPITVKVLVDHVREFGLELEYEDFVEEYRRRQELELRKSVELIPGAMELVAAVQKSTALKYCVASNAPRRKINLNLEVTGLDKFFAEPQIFSAYDIRIWKPDPALFLHAAERIEIAANRCLVLEDSLAGIQAGIAAGMQTIGYSVDQESQPTDQVSFVHDLAELIPFLA